MPRRMAHDGRAGRRYRPIREAGLLEELRPLYAGHKLVLTGGPLAAATGLCRPAEDGERPDGVLSFGPSGVGGFVRLALDPARVPAGPPVAPLAVAAFALADQRFGTAIGPLEPARPVR
jgi:hypothetical protein